MKFFALFFALLGIFTNVHATEDPRLELWVTTRNITVNGKEAQIYQVRQKDGTWGIRAEKGKPLRIRMVNKTAVPITLHPHGLILPDKQDGVPYVTQEPVPSEGTFDYDFVPVQNGTYFLHSHMGFQIQQQMSAPLILTDAFTASTEKEAIMFLTDFLFESPEKEFQKLRSAPAMKTDMTNRGAMKPDLNDVNYDAFLANGRVATDCDIIAVKPGETIRLRVINSAAGTNFFLHLGKLKGRLIAVDGSTIEPISGNEFEIAMAQRLDIIIQIPGEDASFPILAQGEGTDMQAGIMLASEGGKIPALSEKAATIAGAIGLDYKQEKSLHAQEPLSAKPADRFLMELNGVMQGYKWSINGKYWPDTDALMVKEGERVELVFANKSMMSHPMHLHGHVFQVTEIDGLPLSGAKRDTVLVMPHSTVKVQFDATNPGLWMMHCHNLWHAEAGMMTTVNYEGYPLPPYYRKIPVSQ